MEDGNAAAGEAPGAAVEGTAGKESAPLDEVGAFNVTLVLPGVPAPIDAMVSGSVPPLPQLKLRIMPPPTFRCRHGIRFMTSSSSPWRSLSAVIVPASLCV